MLEETEENKKILQNCYVCLILKNLESIGPFKNLVLVAVQCNGIAACAYSLKNVCGICSINTSFLIFLLDKQAPYDPVRVGW